MPVHIVEFPYLNQVESVICLDSIASQSSNLYIHISKPPKEGSANHQLIQVSDDPFCINFSNLLN